MKPKRRVALIHDWLTGMRGGEKVFEVFCTIFPDADVFTLVHLPGKVSKVIESHRIFTSPLQKVPHIEKHYRHLLPLMPLAIEHFDFRGYDLMLSTSHCVAKGAIPPPGTAHWDYCHTPMRYIWDQYEDYFGPGRTGALPRLFMRAIRPYLQQWDLRSTARVQHFIANSENVRSRIRRIYNRDALVIHPPVDYEFFSSEMKQADPTNKEPYFLIVSALAPYKRIDIAIEVFNQIGTRLIIIGDGQENLKLHQMARSNIQFLGWSDNETLRQYYSQAKAVIFPGEEDFGIVPLEAMSAGTPIIAYGKGGALETVLDGQTGVFFVEQTTQSLRDAIGRFNGMNFSKDVIRAQPRSFNKGSFERKIREALIEYSTDMS